MNVQEEVASILGSVENSNYEEAITKLDKQGKFTMRTAQKLFAVILTHLDKQEK